jgi:hypothetical protein
MFQIPGLLISTWSIHPSLSITYVTDLEFSVPYTITDALASVLINYQLGLYSACCVMNAKTFMSPSGGAAHHRGAAGATAAGQCSCTSLISRAFPDLWPPRPEISFCHTIDHCRTILYYSVLFVPYLDLAPRRRYCRLFTLLFRPGGLTGPQTLTLNQGN